MNAIIAFLISTNSIFKLVLFIELVCIAIWGPLTSSIIIALTMFVLLMSFRKNREVMKSFYFALILCLVSVLIVLPGGSRNDIFIATKLAVRFFDIMTVSIVFGHIMKLHDFSNIGKVFHLPKIFILIFMISLVRFIPVAIKSIETVIMAQRSRGFYFTLSSLFKIQTYRALLIPYIICILNSAWWMWISLNLRPIVNDKIPIQKINLTQVFLLFVSFGLWLL